MKAEPYELLKKKMINFESELKSLRLKISNFLNSRKILMNTLKDITALVCVNYVKAMAERALKGGD